MANRTMQAKALKLQRQLRKLPRRIEDPPGKFEKHSGTPIPARLSAEGVSAPRMPNRELMQGYKHRAKSLGMEDKAKRFSGTPSGRAEAQAVIDAMRRAEATELDAETRRLLCVTKFMFNRSRG